MRNIKLIIAYDGTHYFGWQKTKMGPSVEGTLEQVLSKILQRPVTLQAASRTDAGVHADGQVVNFLTTDNVFPLEKLKAALNGLLPKDIVVLKAEDAATDFHPTLHAISKEYRYTVCYNQTQMPHRRYYSWHYPYPLDTDLIKQAIPLLVGQRDFSAFCNARKNSAYSDYVRRLRAITLNELPDNCLQFEIYGDSFLYKMVRNLVGTLVYVGCGKILVEDVKKIIASADRTKAGITAPAHGLFLHRIEYELKPNLRP